MSAKFGILKPGQLQSAKPYRFVKKVVALYLIRRQVVDQIGDFLLREREISKFESTVMSAINIPQKPPKLAEYQHHIEPRLEHLTIVDSPWLRYLHGWD